MFYKRNILNLFEANNSYLSRQEAEKVGANISNKALKAWGQIAYLKEVVENHQKFDSWKNELKADGYDTFPYSISLIIAGALPGQSVYMKVGSGLATGALASWYVNDKKNELEKNEEAKGNGGR